MPVFQGPWIWSSAPSQMQTLRLDILSGVGLQDELTRGHSMWGECVCVGGGREGGGCKEQGILCTTHRECRPDLDVHKVILFLFLDLHATWARRDPNPGPWGRRRTLCPLS